MTIKVLVNLLNFLNRRTALVSVFLLSFAAQAAGAPDRLSADTETAESNIEVALPVGQISLMLGKAYLDSPGQPTAAASVGSVIKVGDRITTGTNGHVHIQFEDDALVSVRPDSRLEIVRYDFNPDRPELSSVKFNLIEGITRSISGQAAKAARQRFRLNTPIAAIGVRGTDFVVSATDSTVRALVNEGIIVMAPYSSACRIDDLGPCGENAVELASESMQIIELDGRGSLPRLLPAEVADDLTQLRGRVQANSNNTEETRDDSSLSKDAYLEDTSTKVASEAELIASTAPPDTPPETPPPLPPELAPAPDFTPPLPVTVSEAKARQLVWGRYADDTLSLERISLSLAEAGIDREVAVGNFEHVLFRAETNNGRVDKGLGVVSFQLHSAQAYYDSASGVVAMQVAGGSLAIDFQESNFATQLNLDHSLTGPIDFVASGKLFDGGHFNSRSEFQRIAGSVSYDGKEAGYFFEQQLDSGNIKGLTLWDSQ